MARRIVKQPNGLYCIFQTTIDNIVSYNLTELDVIKEYQEDAMEKATDDANEGMRIASNPTAFHHTSFSDIMYRVKANHGRKEVAKIKELMEGKGDS